MRNFLSFFTKTKTRILATTMLCLFLAFFLLIYLVIDDDEDEELNLESKFPINDYLFENSSKVILQENNTNAKEDNKFQEVQEKLQNAIKKINDLEKNKKVIVLTEQQRANMNEALKKAQKENPDKKLHFDENGNLVDENGNIIKTREEIEKEQAYKKSLEPSEANKRFIYKNASKEQKRQIKSLAERIEAFQSEEEKLKNKEIEFGVDEFTNLDKQDTGSNEHKLLRTITADKMIPAILIRPISSQLSGEAIAQVETNIYGAMGRAVLIPKGSKVIGKYVNNNKIGEYRLQVIWTRILTPQGINIMLTDAKGADVKGYSGLIGEVYQRNWERYGLPLSLSTLSNGLLIAISSGLNNHASNSNIYNTYATTQILNQSKTDISNIINQIIREQIKINPLIIIKEGSRVFISLSRDIFIPKPKKGETLARFFKEEKREDANEETQDSDIYFE